MGVPEFWKKFIFEQLPEAKWKASGINGAFSLLWDMNGLLYEVANDIYGLGDEINGTKFHQRPPEIIKAIRSEFERDPSGLEGKFISIQI